MSNTIEDQTATHSKAHQHTPATSLCGKWVLVTGASRGVGQQIALGLAQLGANLILQARSEENLAYTLELIAHTNTERRTIAADLTDTNSIQQLINQAEAYSGGIDIVYNNAAIMTPEHSILTTPVDDYKLSMQVNVYAVMQICNFFSEKMKERGFGRIINVTSGIKDTPQLDAYSVSKAALDCYSRNLAVALADSGVLVNRLDPGWCRTDLGGDNAWNDVSSVLPGALIPALIVKKGEDEPRAELYCAQNFAGVSF